MLNIFKHYGNLTDIYIADKRLKNGQRYGFAKFTDIGDEKTMECPYMAIGENDITEKKT